MPHPYRTRPRSTITGKSRLEEASANRLPQLNLSDGELFGNDAGEDEVPEILASYFVDQISFTRFLSTDERLHVSRSKKGMGKSALLAKLAYDLRRSGNHIVIQTTGADLYGIEEPSSLDFMSLQNFWKRVLCTRVNLELGKHIGFAFSDRTMALVEASELAGFKEKNFVGALLQRIRIQKIPIEITSRQHDQAALLKNAYDKFKDRKVWILIDDIDSTFVNSEDMRAKTSTFFSACRNLVREVPNIYIPSAVRTDVWSSLRKNEDLDKFEQYVTDIHWSRRELMMILSKKILAYCWRKFPGDQKFSELDYVRDAQALLEFVFPRRLRWGNASVPPFQPITILSARRPRWMAQLCRLAGVHAATQGSFRIGIHDISQIMPTFGRMRLNDLYKEHEHQFSDLQRLIETFAHGQRRYSTTSLLDRIQNYYVLSVGEEDVPTIEGYKYKDPVQLGHFLFKIGFMLGRREQSGHPDLADFVVFEERPELLTDSRNLDDGMVWEIYPSYRNVLRIR